MCSQLILHRSVMLEMDTSVREQLERACRDWGAFHVINRGVPVELLAKIRRLGRSFFEDCTIDQKLSYACDPNSPASEGYGSRMLVAFNDTVLDWRDHYDHHTLPLSRRNPSKWPHFSPNYRLSKGKKAITELGGL